LSVKYLQSVVSVGLIALLAACASTPPKHSASPVDHRSQNTSPTNAIAPSPMTCEPDIDLATESVLRKLALANEWHTAKQYQSAFEAYESALAEHSSLLSDAYALWGIIALRLDRENPAYSREAAQTAIYVLDQRVQQALTGEASNEARLLWFSAELMITSDVSKDQVMAENVQLNKELAQREEAIQRLRELTLGK
jgi:tetratricopeptide (TPR) repeat protein